ncbi:aminotransferase class V-fold PLP-dependent enzyme [Paraburkholderia sp.]|uniref:aminotransferase class V-fold PLP-dependent enzyme n=1 Tax=Paraburkholderia sp. TaxID=1926495 RepID=UPI0039E39F3C
MTLLDNAVIRADFPVAGKMLYLDSAHQTPLGVTAKRAIEDFLAESFETAGPKPKWLARVEQVRGVLASFVGASADEIAYTKNTSEGLNIAANAIDLNAGDNVLLIEGDHPNNAYAWLNLRRKGIEVRFVKLSGAVANAQTFAPYIDSKTRVISLSHVTFHAGQRHDIRSIGQLCKEKALYLVVDAMQSVGVLPLDVKDLGISILAAGCHKGLLVPQGLGFLYVDSSLDSLEPIYLAMAGIANPPADFIARPDDVALRAGAGRFEIGNFNLPGIHALGATLNLLGTIGVDNVEAHVLSLGDRLIEHLDDLRIPLVGPRNATERAHIYTLALSPDWLAYFAENNVRVSPERDGIRISFGIFNDETDVDAVADLIRKRLQASAIPRSY